MSDIAVQVENLSKMYRLGVINHGTLRKDIQSWIALKQGKEDPNSKIGADKYSGDKDHFWALKNISFDVKKGDRVGIIGKNGAGKSTLLKILSRITAPTEGCIKIRGKIASLLEVGTGFHRDLTGRENIFLNGAILGMKKRQIQKKLDSIIDFSGIEHHIDTPVKRYSSGMYIRLAFAVAVHLDSDILIADEVLSVGDADFQKKALGKMQDLSTGEGRTVFFVSHNMGMVKKLCNIGIVIQEGRILYTGNIDTSINKYTQHLDGVSRSNGEIYYSINETTQFQLTKIEILNKNNTLQNIYEIQDTIKIRLHCISRKPVPNLYGYFTLRRNDTEDIIICDSKESTSNVFNAMAEGTYTVDMTIPKSILSPAEYCPNFNFTDGFSYIVHPLEGPKFKVVDTTSLRGSRNTLTSLILDWVIANSSLACKR